MKTVITIFFFISFLHTIIELKALPVLSYNLVNGLQNIYLDPLSEKIGHTWSKGSVWDKKLIEKFYTLLPHDCSFVVLDLGAQTGCFSLLAKYFPKSSWYAFEPIQEAVDTLNSNLILNEINNVEVYQVAVTNFSGRTLLKMPDINNWGLSTIGSNALRFDTYTEREIPCIDLDTFVRTHEIKKVDFIKIDTEGAEFFILQGARQLLMRDHPIIVMEYNKINMKQCGVVKKDVDDFLTRMGYTWELISNEDILCTPLFE